MDGSITRLVNEWVGLQTRYEELLISPLLHHSNLASIQSTLEENKRALHQLQQCNNQREKDHRGMRCQQRLGHIKQMLDQFNTADNSDDDKEDDEMQPAGPQNQFEDESIVNGDGRMSQSLSQPACTLPPPPSTPLPPLERLNQNGNYIPITSPRTNYSQRTNYEQVTSGIVHPQPPLASNRTNNIRLHPPPPLQPLLTATTPPTPFRRDYFEPTWPQRPVSHIPGIQQFKRIEEWKKKLPRAKSDHHRPPKIVYALNANSDHRNSHHFFPEDISEQLWETVLNRIYYQPTMRKFWGLDWQNGGELDSHTEDGEYAIYESHALPFYLRYIFDKPHDLFELCPKRLLAVSIIVDQLFIWKQQQATIDDKIKNTHACFQSAKCTFKEHLRRLKRTKVPPQLDQDTDLSPPDIDEVLETWEDLEESDICILPSVLLMNKKHTAREWYAGLRLLEVEAGLVVFPKIAVESHMENKELYLYHLMTSPNYVTLMESEQPQAQPTARVATETESKSNVSPASTARPNHTYQWANTASYQFSDGSNLLGPTILLEVSEYEKVPPDDRPAFIYDLREFLEGEVEAGGWKAEKDLIIVKGCNSTRTNVLKRCRDQDEVIQVMEEAMKNGMKLVSAHNDKQRQTICAFMFHEPARVMYM